MIMTLNEPQTRAAIRELVPQGMCDLNIPEPIDPARMEEFCAGLAAQDWGRVYGWFDPEAKVRGFLAGLIIADALTNVKHGIEHYWWAAPEWRSRAALPLMKHFEAACKEAECKRITFGFSEHVKPKLMHRLYQMHGYKDWSTSMSKEII